MLLREACTQFLAHCRSVVSLSSHTMRAYTADLNDVCQFMGTDKAVTNITKEDLRSYIRYLREIRQFKETSTKRRIACLKIVFRWLTEEEHLQLNPFDSLNERIRLPKRLPRALDREQLQQLRQGLGRLSSKTQGFDTTSEKTAILVLLETGIRVGELASLTIDDVSLADRSLSIHGKGNRQRLVFMLSRPLHKALENYLRLRKQLGLPNPQLFTTSSGLPLTPPRVRKALHNLTEAAGIERRITPHMLRHTCATQWLEAGLDIRFVQKLLGHQSISTTEIYTHVSDQSLKEALGRVLVR